MNISKKKRIQPKKSLRLLILEVSNLSLRALIWCEQILCSWCGSSDEATTETDDCDDKDDGVILDDDADDSMEEVDE